MTLKRLNEIAIRMDFIRMKFNLNDEVGELDKIEYCDELIEYSEELIEVNINNKYFCLIQAVLHDLQSLCSDLLK